VVKKTLDAMVREVGDVAAGEIGTVYFGGGTPSLVEAYYIERLLAVVREKLARDVEITLEANPESVTPAKLAAWRAAGVNRLSLGVQAAQDWLLAAVGRCHTVAQARQAIEWARAAGFDNLSLDGMMGLPGQTMDDWRQTLELLAEAEHASCYALEVHEGTPLGERVTSGLACPDEDAVAEMMDETARFLPTVGLERYEISNWARPGRESRHNSCYWNHTPYIGIGPGAHGFENDSRYANAGAIEAYVALVARTGRGHGERQVIDGEELAREAVMLGLRRVEGIGLSDFAGRFGRELISVATHRLWIEKGLAQDSRERLALTHDGFMVSNALIGELLGF